MRLLLWTLAGYLGLAAATQAAQASDARAGTGGEACHCEGAQCANVVWQGLESHAPSYRDLARLAAPVFWYSPDELYAPAGPERYPAPSAQGREHQNTEPAGPATVYFSVVSPFDAPDDRAIPMERRWIRIRYFHYYRRDAGHVGDLETVTLTLRPVQVQQSRCWELRLLSATGDAHGSFFLANTLAIGPTSTHAPDLRLPLTILVEENKHASAPDRNGDGVFTPGYDVNRSVRDAWGLRDNFGHGFFASGFEASMAKSRRHSCGIRARLVEAEERCGTSCGMVSQTGLEPGCERSVERSYCLESVHDLPEDGDSHNPRERSRRPSFLKELALNYAAVLPPFFAGRYDPERGWVLTAVVPIISETIGFLPTVPYLKWNVALRWSVAPSAWGFDVLVTPSLGGRASDWYFAAAMVTRTLDDESLSWRWFPAEYEAGLRLRFKPQSEWLPVLGLRIGVRTDAWSVGRARFVVEIGGGLM